MMKTIDWLITMGLISLNILLGIFIYNGYQQSKVHIPVIENTTVVIQQPVKQFTQLVWVKPIKLDKKQLQCLRMNVFYEAGVESKLGKLAVAQVTMNRVESSRYADTVCSVVYDKYQFSWTLDKSKRFKTPSGPLWKESKQVVDQFLKGARIANLEDSMYYHTDKVKPKWSSSMEKVAQIGNHLFFTNN